MYWFLYATTAYIAADKQNCRKGIRDDRYFILIADAFVAYVVTSGGAYQGREQWR